MSDIITEYDTYWAFKNNDFRQAVKNLYEVWRQANYALNHDIEKGFLTESDAIPMFCQELEDGNIDEHFLKGYLGV